MIIHSATMCQLRFSLNVSGNHIFQWLLSQCNDCETKKEYDRSHYLLTQFLLLPETKQVIGSPCVNAIIKLKNNLAAKEEKYAGYGRMHIKNCMGTMIT